MITMILLVERKLNLSLLTVFGRLAGCFFLFWFCCCCLIETLTKQRFSTFEIAFEVTLDLTVLTGLKC